MERGGAGGHPSQESRAASACARLRRAVLASVPLRRSRARAGVPAAAAACDAISDAAAGLLQWQTHEEDSSLTGRCSRRPGQSSAWQHQMMAPAPPQRSDDDGAHKRRTAAPSIKPALSCPVLTLHPHQRRERERERGERLPPAVSNGQGGERGAGARGAGAQGLRRPAAGAALRHGRAPDVVLLPGPHRRVRRHAALPLHHRRHRHRLQGAVGERPVRRRRGARHRLGLRRHDLRPRLLHRWHLRGTHQPGRHLRPPPGAQGLPAARRALHRGAVRGGHRGRRHRQGHHEGRVPGQRRRRQHGRLRLLPRHRAGGRDRRHLRPRLHRLLRHRPQAQRPRLPRPRARPAPHRLRRLHGPPRHHPHHRHRHQPRQEPRRRSHLQQEGRMGQPLDLLGWPVRRRAGGGGIPPVHPPGGGHQGARLLPEQPEQLSRPAGRPII